MFSSIPMKNEEKWWSVYLLQLWLGWRWFVVEIRDWISFHIQILPHFLYLCFLFFLDKPQKNEIVYFIIFLKIHISNLYYIFLRQHPKEIDIPSASADAEVSLPQLLLVFAPFLHWTTRNKIVSEMLQKVKCNINVLGSRNTSFRLSIRS